MNKGEKMFKALKMNLATRRINRKNAVKKGTKKATKKNSFWSKLLETVKKPFRKIANWCRQFWLWVRSIDLIGLVNITLLSAIIVLFSMLIIDIIGCSKKNVIIIAKNQETLPAQQYVVSKETQPKIVRKRAVKKVASLPLHRDSNRQYIEETINVIRAYPDKVAIKQTARANNVMYGDIIIDSRGAATMLKTGDVIKGNLFLQNMRKYTLPCGVIIEGDLYLRNMGLLQFAGEFTVTGNIYVTPTSSFGPLPGTARIGGQVIL